MKPATANRLPGLSVLTLLLTGLFLLMISLFWTAPSSAVIGPLGDYSEASGDRIEICTALDAGYNCVDPATTFSVGNTVYIRITTSRVASSILTNTIKLLNYSSTTAVASSTFTQRASSPPYVYTGSVAIPSNTTKYLKVQGQVQSLSANLKFEEALEMPSLSDQYIRFFKQSGQVDESYAFRPGDTVYITAYGTGTAANGTNFLRLTTFDDVSFNSINPGVVTTSGANLYNLTYTMPALGGSAVDGDWYWLETKLARANGSLVEQMSRMVLLDGSDPAAGIASPAPGACLSGSADVTGTASDLYSFSDWILEYGAGASPGAWTAIGSTGSAAVNGGLLRSWDTAAVADGLYSLRLTVNDRAGNQAQVSQQADVDNNAPVVSGVGTGSVSSTAATVGWSTDEAADSLVQYDTDSGEPYSYSVVDGAFTTSHGLALGGLFPGTTYYYRVRSVDSCGNETWSAQSTFQTVKVTVLQPFPAVARDTAFESGQPDYNRGASAQMAIGDDTAYGSSRSQLRFDLSGLPAGATVVSATLSLYQMAQDDSSAINLDAHYLTRDWTEGTGTGSATGDGATWSTYDGVSAWTSAGGDFSPAASASAVAPDSAASWVSWNLTAPVQGWVAGSLANYGALIRQDTEIPSGSDAKTYYSSNHAGDASLRPKLIVEWLGTDVDAPATGEIEAKNITLTSSDIIWSTDENSDSRVEYGTTTSYGTSTPLDPSLVNQHSVHLDGLTGDTMYHYRVRSADASGNETVSEDHVFQTARLLTIQPEPAGGSDTRISSNTPDLNYGASQDIVAGRSAGQSRGLLRFDLSDITAGSTINSATLSLYQHAQADSSVYQLGVFSAARSWTGGTGDGTLSADGATWVTYDGAGTWTAAGGDFDPAVKAAASAPDSTAAWIDFDVTTLSRSWVDDPSGNRGVFIRKTDESPGTDDFKTFYASEYSADTSLRPKLVIEYVPSPSTITLNIDETYNFNGTAGAGSVDFGTVAPGSASFIGNTADPQYAVKLTVSSNSVWGLKVSAVDDLKQANPANLIDIVNLAWKQDEAAPETYASLVKSPAETIIFAAMAPTAAAVGRFDYRLSSPALAVPGSYSTVITYTAFTY